MRGTCFPARGLREEGVEGVVAAADGLVGGHLAIGLDAVLKAEQLPHSVSGLHTVSLSKEKLLRSSTNDKMLYICLQ